MRKFMDKHTFEERAAASHKMLEKYPNRTPIICEPAAKSNIELSENIKTKYLVPRDITVGKFLLSLRDQLHLPSETAIFLFVNHTLPPTSHSIGDIYERHKNEDGFLYIEYAGESAFG